MANRIYVLSLGIDRTVDSPDRGEAGAGGGPPEPYRAAVEIAVWRELRGGGQMGGGGGQAGISGAQKPAWILASTSETVAEALDNLRERSFRTLSLAQLKVVIIGEQAARHGIDDTLDYLERNQEVQRRVTLAVAPGEALKILQVRTMIDQLAAFTLPRLITEARAAARAPEASIGEAMTWRETSTGFVVPRVRASGKELVVAGAGVFRGERLVDWLGEEECRGLAWLAGQPRDEILSFPCPIRPGKHYAVRVTGVRRRLKVRVEQGRPVFAVSLSCRIDFLESPHRFETKDDVARAQSAAAEVIRAQVEAALKAGKRSRTDFFGFGTALKGAWPAVWDRLGKGWDDYFAQAVRVELREVKVALRHLGQVR